MLARIKHGIGAMASFTQPTNPSRSRGFFSWMGAGTTLPVHVDEYSAMTLSAVYRSVALISGDIAMLPWHVHEKKGEARTTIEDHPVADLLNRSPNPEMKAVDFKQSLMGHVLTWGNGYAEIEYSRDGTPVALWPMLPDRMSVDRSENGSLVYVWRSDSGEEVLLPQRRVFHVHGPSFDGLTGYSPIRLAMLSLSTAKATEQFGASFFASGARPSGVLEHPGKVDKEVMERLRHDWTKVYGGTKNAGKVAILEQGMKYTQLGLPPEEAQFIETKKFSVGEIARWFGVPPHKIGDLEKTTIGNIEEQERAYKTDALDYWVTAWQEEVGFKLLTREQGEGRNVYARLNLKARLRADQKSRAEYYAKMAGLGVLSINEIRAAEDMEPIEDGDVRFVPLNMGRLGEPEPDQSDTGARGQHAESHALNALRGVMGSAVAQIVAKCEKATGRARAKHDGDGIKEWAESFYGDLFAECVRVVGPGVHSLAAFAGVDEGADGVTLALREWASWACESMHDLAVSDAAFEPDESKMVDRLASLAGAAVAAATKKEAEHVV